MTDCHCASIRRTLGLPVETATGTTDQRPILHWRRPSGRRVRVIVPTMLAKDASGAIVPLGETTCLLRRECAEALITAAPQWVRRAK